MVIQINLNESPAAIILGEAVEGADVWCITGHVSRINKDETCIVFATNGEQANDLFRNHLIELEEDGDNSEVCITSAFCLGNIGKADDDESEATGITGCASEVERMKECLPGVNLVEIRHACMLDIVGDYDIPDDVPEWKWIEEYASFSHRGNGIEDGVWELIINLENFLDNIPERLAPVIAAAHQHHCAYIIFHQ